MSELNDQIIETLRELADDLEAEITAKYQGLTCYPVQQRRMNRDMEPVNRARELIRRAKLT